MSILGFVLALGGGFYLGRWLTQPDDPKFQVQTGERYRVSLRGDEPQHGPSDALVTIVEFSDFECPYCGKAVGPLEDAAKEHDNDVRIVFKHYPLPFHAKALPAAKVAWAAHKHGKFWDIHDWLFETRGDIRALPEQLAELGIDGEQFGRDMASAEAAAAVDQDMLDGGKVGISGTPAFIVNGRPYSGSKTESQWHDIIEAELADAKALLDRGVPRADIYATLMADAKAERPKAERGKKRGGEPDPNKRYAVHTADRPALGPSSALVTIVAFSDFQCPFCSKASATVHEVVAKHPDVRVVFRQLPLAMHAQARDAAKAALAAHRQGKFWEMHDLLFANQTTIASGTWEWFAIELGLDVSRFKTDMGDPELEKVISEDEATAHKFGIRGTPAFFVNGKYMSGAQPVGAFDSEIERARTDANVFVEQGVTPERVYAKIIEGGETEVKPEKGG